MTRLFPTETPSIEAADLHSMIEDADRPVLLDTRSVEEYSVSRIPGARLVVYDDFAIDDVDDIPRDAAVVVYCAVGFRSGRVLERMREAGYVNVRNLEGGIVAWANADFPLVDDNGQTNRVHGSGPAWGRHVTNESIEVVYEAGTD